VALVGRGQSLVLSAKLDEAGEWDVFRIVGGEPQVQNLTADFRGNAHRPRLSPDRGHVAFVGEVDDQQQLWVMTASGAERRSVESRRGRFGPDLRDWYDDRTLVYYDGPERGKGFIRTVGIDGTDDRVLIHSPFKKQHNFGDVRLSPDRQTIALLAQVGSWGPTHDLYLVAADGKSDPKTFYEDPGDSNDDAFILWTHAGTDVYWMHYQESGPGQKRPAVVKKSIRSPEPKHAFDQVVRAAGKDASALLAISPDDGRLLIRDGPGGNVVAFDIRTKDERPVLAVPAVGRMDWR
jgi:Tol biopolymer transport system component